MQIRHVIIKVDDQDKGLSFYTSIVGFVKRLDFPIGRVRWLTVYSREGAAGVELVLEPNNFPPALTSQNALYDASFPAAVLTTTGRNENRGYGTGHTAHRTGRHGASDDPAPKPA